MDEKIPRYAFRQEAGSITGGWLIQFANFTIDACRLHLSSAIEQPDRKRRDKETRHIGAAIRRVLADFADQTVGTWRRRAYYPGACKAARPLSARAD